MGLWVLGSTVVSCKPHHGCRGEEARSKDLIWLILTALALAFSKLRVHDGCGGTLEEGVVLERNQISSCQYRECVKTKKPLDE